MPRKLTNGPRLSDIAKKAGVSSATVSNVLRNVKGANTETGMKILRIAKEMHYTPSHTMRIMQKITFILYKKSGLVIMDSPFFSDLIAGIEKECRSQHYELNITYLQMMEPDTEEQRDAIIDNASCPILLLATEMDENDLDPFLRAKVPLLVLDSHFRTKEVNMVVMDNVEAGILATNYLLDNGHRRIGCILSSFPFNNMSERFLGFQFVMQARQMPYEEENIFYVWPTLESAYLDMVEILKAQKMNMPTAFFAGNDIIAISASRAFKQAHYRLPEDISIVGMDDMPMCSIVSPTLTTIAVQKAMLGKIAVQRLIDIQNNDSELVQRTFLQVKLVERNSIKKLKQA